MTYKIEHEILISIRNPVLRDHRFAAQHLLPGLAYIDILFQTLMRTGLDVAELELRDLAIHRPLIVALERDIVLRIEATPRGDSEWSVELTGRPRAAVDGDAPLCYAVATLLRRHPSVAFDETLAWDDVPARATATMPLQAVYDASTGHGIEYGPFMRAAGEAYLTDAAIYVDCRLAGGAQSDAASLLFHPALLDASMMAATTLLNSLDGPYRAALPLSYERFCAARALPDAFRVRVDRKRTRRHGELAYLSMEFFDLDGRKIAELDDFATKRLPDARAPFADAATTQVDVASPASAAPPPSDTDGYPALTDLLREVVAAQARRASHDIGVGDSFYEMGITSTGLLEIARRIEAHLGSRQPPTLLFQYSNIDQLARHLVESGAWRGHAAAAGANAPLVAAAQPDQALRLRKRKRRAKRIDIAIVGLSGRYPQARSAEALWEKLRSGADCVTEIPAERWDGERDFDARKGVAGKSYAKWGGFLSGVEEFDPLFFGMSPREAQYTDPQQRLFLETVWDLLEGSGYTRERLARECGGRVGVYVGSMYSQYDGLQERAPSRPVLQSMQSGIANRVSHYFGLTGPSVAIDTMCSSSIVALHLACADVRRGECALAIAGGVNLTLDARKYVSLSQAQLLSSRFDARSFGDSDGYLPAEAVGAVLLKPLRQAEADGDAIWAVVKSTATNHAGSGQAYQVPNVQGQVAVMREALRRAGVSGETISCVEAAASGGLADAMEVAALGQVLGGTAAGACALGSVKSNLGHAEAASGITQLSKVLLQLKHGVLVPTIGSEPQNPNLDFAGTRLRLQRELGVWERPRVGAVEQPRRALINAFGAGGSNASAILEEYRGGSAALDEAQPPEPATEQVLVFSGRTGAGLRAVVRQMSAWLAQQATVRLADLAYTLQECREAMEHRLALVVRDRSTLERALHAYCEDRTDLAGVVRHEGDLETAAQWRRMASPEMVQQLLQQALAERDAEQAARLWVQQVAVDWSALRSGAGRRLTLPTYPFARERYWVPQQDAVAQASVGGADPASFIAQFLGSALGLTPGQWSAHAPLQRYGVDSLVGLRLVHALNARFGVTLGARDLLTARSAHGLAERVQAEMAQRAVTEPGVPAPVAAAPAQAPDRIALSEGQKGLWAHHNLQPDADVYNLPLAIRLGRAPDAQHLEGAWQHVCATLPLLHSRVETVDGEPYLVPLRPEGALVRTIDAQGWDAAQVEQRLRELSKTPMRLGQGPLLQVHWLRGATGGDVLLILIHHLVFDASSMPPLLDALLDAYAALAQGAGLPAPEAATEYAAFVAAERDYLAGARAQRDRAYWQTQWHAPLPVLELPTDRARQRDGRVEGQTRYGAVDAGCSAQVRAYCAAQGVSAAAVMLGLYELLLYRYSGEAELMVGVPTQGRWDARYGSAVGYFMNLVALRSRRQPQWSLARWVEDTQERLVDALDHAAYPFARLVRELRVAREPGRTPVFQAAFEFQNAAVLQQGRLAQRLSEVLGGEFTPWVNQEGEYEIVLEVVETASAYGLRLKYDGRLFDAGTMEGFLAHYAALLETFAQAPQQAIEACRAQSAAERERVLYAWNATQRAVAPHSVLELIAAQVQQRPQALALECGEDALDYAELDRRSDALARYLAAQGIGRGALVGVCLARAADLVVGLLGVLKSGAAYVPLAPEYPPARLGAMIGASGLACVLSERRWQALLQPLLGAVRALLLDAERAAIDASPPCALPAPRPQDLAYVIYTSGSTGQPKGVMVEHRALSNFLQSMREEPGLNAQDRLLALTTYSFDIAALELYLPLVVGATCIVASAEQARDAQRLEAAIAAYRPTVMQATPATWQLLLQHGWRNREQVRIWCGGEALSERLKEALRASGAALWNLFGPTETTIWSTVERLGADAVTIGRPIANTQVYILDEHLEPVGTGERGDLYIGGEGLARGYLGRPGLTAERFIANPFGAPGSRLYRTGDVARFRADGRVQYLGRSDSQVKIRGFRIELGEIEAALRGCAGVQQCAATTFANEAGERYIAAFAVAAPGATFDTETLRATLACVLPDYMLPSAYVVLDALPLTPNNKVDYKALPQPDLAPPDRAYVAPRNLDERWLATLWQEALHVERVGMADNFVALGGHSLSAMKIVGKVRQRFGFDVKLHSLFEAATLSHWCETLRAQRRDESAAPAVDEETSALLARVRAMSDAEVALALNELRKSLHEAQ